MFIILSMLKKSEAGEQVIADQSQQVFFFLAGGQGAGDGHGADHGGENQDEILLFFSGICSRHEFQQLLLVCLHTFADFFAGSGTSARNIRRERSDGAAPAGIVAMFDGEIAFDDFLPTFAPRSLLRPIGQLCSDLASSFVDGFREESVFAGKVLIKTSVSQAGGLHEFRHTRSVHAVISKLARSALHDAPMGLFFVLRLVTHGYLDCDSNPIGSGGSCPGDGMSLCVD